MIDLMMYIKTISFKEKIQPMNKGKIRIFTLINLSE